MVYTPLLPKISWNWIPKSVFARQEIWIYLSTVHPGFQKHLNVSKVEGLPTVVLQSGFHSQWLKKLKHVALMEQRCCLRWGTKRESNTYIPIPLAAAHWHTLAFTIPLQIAADGRHKCRALSKCSPDTVETESIFRISARASDTDIVAASLQICSKSQPNSPFVLLATERSTWLSTFMERACHVRISSLSHSSGGLSSTMLFSLPFCTREGSTSIIAGAVASTHTPGLLLKIYINSS